MTNHKELKHLVRERAARTGESYTTARRHVLARSVVPGYPTSEGGDHHDSTLLAHLLDQAGHRDPRTGRPYTETTLCGLAGGIGFLYAVFEYRGGPPMVTLVAQHHPEPWAQSALTRLGIGHTVTHSSAARPALAALDAALTSGRAVHCLVSRAALPWHRSSGALHADPYAVVVAGRRDDALLIDDGPGRPRLISVADFAVAWSAHRKGRHQRIVVSGPDRPVDLAAAMRDAISTTTAHLTGPVLGNSFDVNMGFSGMTRFADQLRDTRGRAGWTRRMTAPGALAAALQRVHSGLEVEYTAPSATRPLYAGFLDEAATALDQPVLSEAAALFRVSGRHWSAVAALARSGTRPGLLTELAHLVDAAADAERHAVEIMSGAVLRR